MLAAKRAGVPYKQTAIGEFLTVNKQSVDTWMNGSLPRADKMFEIADRFGVDPRWLATGAGEMLPAVHEDNLKPQVKDLVTRYEAAEPRWQSAIRTVAHIATTEGEVSGAQTHTRAPEALFRGRDGMPHTGRSAKAKRFSR